MIVANQKTIQFIVENYPTMPYEKLMSITGYSLSNIKRVAYKHNVYRQRKGLKPSIYIDGDEKNIKGCRYIRVNNKWKPYIVYVYEQNHPPLKNDQCLKLVDVSKGVTEDNIMVCQKKYVKEATSREVSFVSSCCDVVGIKYDTAFVTRRKRRFTVLKQVICALHKEMFEYSDGISYRQARLGAAIGRDRTMVMVYEKKHIDDYKFNPEYRKLYDKVKREYDTKEV